MDSSDPQHLNFSFCLTRSISSQMFPFLLSCQVSSTLVICIADVSRHLVLEALQRRCIATVILAVIFWHVLFRGSEIQYMHFINYSIFVSHLCLQFSFFSFFSKWTKSTGRSNSTGGQRFDLQEPYKFALSWIFLFLSSFIYAINQNIVDRALLLLCHYLCRLVVKVFNKENRSVKRNKEKIIKHWWISKVCIHLSCWAVYKNK